MASESDKAKLKVNQLQGDKYQAAKPEDVA